jgi:hypothetical protein
VRVSTDHNDPGYDAFRKAILDGKSVFVFLDGKDMTGRCRTADDEDGFVVRLAMSDTGDPLIEGDCFVYETVTGNVEIITKGRLNG